MEIFILAGESSGDQLGGRLMKSLREAYRGEIRFVGVGGERMKERGLRCLLDMEELSVNGLVDVLRRIWRLMGHIRRLTREVIGIKPDIVITIDSPGFVNFFLRKVRRDRPADHRYPLIHCVAPTVWAWKPERAEEAIRIYDHLLVLFPFEVDYFREGFATYIGHPVVELGIEEGDGEGFRRRHGIDSRAMVLNVLAGSRASEIRRLRGVLDRVIRRVRRVYPEVVVIVSVLPSTEGALRGAFEDVILVRQEEKYDSYLASDVAIAASGTVALELAMASVPMVTAYRIDFLSYGIGRYWYRWGVSFSNLVNILLGFMVVPEFIQSKCDDGLIGDTLIILMKERSLRTMQRIGYSRALERIRPEGGGYPSERGARKILEIYRGGL